MTSGPGPLRECTACCRKSLGRLGVSLSTAMAPAWAVLRDEGKARREPIELGARLVRSVGDHWLRVHQRPHRGDLVEQKTPVEGRGFRREQRGAEPSLHGGGATRGMPARCR